MKYVAGDVITTSKPLVYAVNQRNKGKICDRCLKNYDGLKRCSKCKCMSYCSVNCQRDDWREFHKHECQILNELSKVKMEIYLSIHLLIRMCIKYHYAMSTFQRKWILFDGRERVIGDMTNRSDLCTGTIQPLLIAITGMLNCFGVTVTYDTVVYRFGQIMGNNINISNDLHLLKREDPYIAGGFYVEPSVFDHSCRPNAICVFDGPIMTVRALNEIDTDKEKITISYQEGTTMLPKDIRKDQLKKYAYFDCICDTCMDPNYSDASRMEFMTLIPRMFNAMNEQKSDEVEKHFGRCFYLSQSVLGRYSKVIIEYMLLLIQYKYNFIRTHNLKPRIEDIIEWTEFQSYLRKTHGTKHPLYEVCLQFGKIICPSKMLYITGTADNPDFIHF